MKILCNWFGHRLPKTLEYGELRGGTVDGIGRVHAYVRIKCPRCTQEYTVCDVHIPAIDYRTEKRDGYFDFVKRNTKK